MNIQGTYQSNGKTGVKHGQGSGKMPESTNDPAHIAQVSRKISKTVSKHS
jgi:hypothetical protein